MIINHWVQWGTLFSDKPIWWIYPHSMCSMEPEKHSLGPCFVEFVGVARWISTTWAFYCSLELGGCGSWFGGQGWWGGYRWLFVLTIEIVGHDSSSLFTSFYCHRMYIILPEDYPALFTHRHVMLQSPCVRGVSEVQHAAWSPSILPPRDTWPRCAALIHGDVLKAASRVRCWNPAEKKRKKNLW